MSRNLVLVLFGIIFLLTGIVFVLREWANLIIVFKGISGGLLAVLGIFMLYLASGKSDKS